ncbi:hypothetical protein KFK09_008414 [Dendrobium nobile]|uniref:Histidine-containing phosphotransfer protein n=1 Tax=Dendrobium nobile TaxID=94219 RepID=A0A8T3BL32_DENNO|nr:hypothetical protein KFK09_008414 [Dendrobium nobile]
MILCISSPQSCHRHAKGLLDQNFTQLEMREARTPGFEEDFIQTFYEDAERIFTSLERLLDPLQISSFLHPTSVAVGCPTIKRDCIKFREFCELQDKQGYVSTL